MDSPAAKTNSRRQPEDMFDKTIPLLDLHRHLDGNLRLDTVLDLEGERCDRMNTGLA